MGGKAFQNTSRINRQDVLPVVDWLGERWSDFSKNGGQPANHILGSAGKNDTSGDIDLNLRLEVYDQDLVAGQMRELLGDDNVRARPSHNQIFTSMPVPGQDTRVQVDLMFGHYDWQAFSYYAPQRSNKPLHPYERLGNKSYLKGLYRTELIKALVAFCSDWVLEDRGEMVARVGPTFFHDRGCVWRYRHRPLRKDGSGQRIKELKELSRDEFMAIYPSATPARKDVMLDPNEVLAMLSMGNASLQGADHSFEKLMQVSRVTFNQSDLKTISRIYLERLNSLKVEVPQAYLKRHGVKIA